MLRIPVLTLVLTTLLTVNVQAADEIRSVTKTEIRELHLDDLAGAIQLIGKGQLEDSIDLIARLNPGRFQSASENPFEEADRDRAVRVLRPIAEEKPNFESAELIGIEPLSTRIKKLTFIAIGERGAILFQFHLFRYKNNYLLGNVSYHAAWDTIEAKADAVNNRVSKMYEFGTSKTKK